EVRAVGENPVDLGLAKGDSGPRVVGCRERRWNGEARLGGRIWRIGRRHDRRQDRSVRSFLIADPQDDKQCGDTDDEGGGCYRNGAASRAPDELTHRVKYTTLHGAVPAISERFFRPP